MASSRGVPVLIRDSRHGFAPMRHPLRRNCHRAKLFFVGALDEIGHKCAASPSQPTPPATLRTPAIVMLFIVMQTYLAELGMAQLPMADLR